MGWYRSLWMWSHNMSPRYTKLHHFDDAGYDMEIVQWVWVDNPNYIGNFLQRTGWYEERKRVYKDWHTVEKEVIE